jgi:hypothetical protein
MERDIDTMQKISTVGEPDQIYYVTEARNATLRELLRLSPPTVSGKLGALFLKILKPASPPQMGMAFNDPLRCSVADIPELTKMFDSTIRSLAHLSFSPSIAMRLPTLGEGSCCSLALLGKVPTVYANIVHSKAWANGQEYDESGLSFISRDATTVWVTSGLARTLNSPQVFNVEHYPAHSPEILYTAHCKRIKAVPPETLRVFDIENLWFTLRENEAMITEFNIGRGVFRPMTTTEIRAITKGKKA